MDDTISVATVAEEFVVMLAVECAGDEMNPSRQFQQALNRFSEVSGWRDILSFLCWLITFTVNFAISLRNSLVRRSKST